MYIIVLENETKDVEFIFCRKNNKDKKSLVLQNFGEFNVNFFYQNIFFILKFCTNESMRIKCLWFPFHLTKIQCT
jgi:hypothetical protein